MRIASLLTAATAVSAVLADPQAAGTADQTGRRAGSRIGSRRHGRGVDHNRMALAMRDGYSAVSTQKNRCLDIKDHQLQNGAALQLWRCTGGANQQFALNQGQLQGANGLCVDVPDGRGANGARLQLWTCHEGNTNQMFEPLGDALRWTQSNLCLDVTDGLFKDGTLLQLWQCDAANPNQQFTAPNLVSGTPTSSARPSATQASANGGNLATTGNFLGFSAIPFAAFVALHPQIAGFADAYLQAGAATQIAPTLLGAISLQESSGNCNAGNGGLFQFQNDDAWNAYGNGGNRYNCYDATWGGARYLRALLDQNGNNLAQALRSYNGPVSQGGLPQYIDNIGAWMTGAFVYGPGT